MTAEKQTRISLRRGRAQDVAQLTGYPVTYVWQVLRGARNNDAILEKAREVALEDLRQQQELLQRQLATLEAHMKEVIEYRVCSSS